MTCQTQLFWLIWCNIITVNELVKQGWTTSKGKQLINITCLWLTQQEPFSNPKNTNRNYFDFFHDVSINKHPDHTYCDFYMTQETLSVWKLWARELRTLFTWWHFTLQIFSKLPLATLYGLDNYTWVAIALISTVWGLIESL